MVRYIRARRWDELEALLQSLFMLGVGGMVEVEIGFKLSLGIKPEVFENGTEI